MLAPVPSAEEDPAGSEGKEKKPGIFNRLRDPKPAAEAPAPAGELPAPAEVAAPAPRAVDDKEARRLAKEREDLEREAARGTSGGRKLDRIVARLRVGPIGQDVLAVPYLDLIETGQATASELNDFASYVARKGLVEDALEFQRRAIELDPKNSRLWLNLGTLQRGVRRPGAAEAAYRRAIDLDPANALAWYNLGVVQDARDEYEPAIESFRRAFTLDPTLADAKVNPQVVGNDRMLVVQLLLSQQKTGALGLPLVPMQTRAAPPAAPSAPVAK
jgi:tetratricopeptide (TPR) repeat protein